MTRRLFPLRQLSARERQALALIRGGGAMEPETLWAEAFALLAARAKEGGLVVLSSESPFLHEDEKSLLAWLTRLQRQRPSRGYVGAVPADRPILDPLRECARLLSSAGIHLSYHTGWREKPFEHPLMDRVTQLLAKHGALATQELREAGVSQHAIGVLRKTGLLQRVRYGLYTLGPATHGQPDGPGVSASLHS